MDLALKCENDDIMEAAGESGDTLITVLRTLEGGEGKLTKK